MLIVSDTSPISNLILIGRLSLLREMYQVVVVPPKVHAEVLALEDFGEDISAYTTAEWFEIKAPEDVALVQQLLEKLDEGEAEAIALAKELSADFLLIDERRGWKIADEMGISSIGLIGILLKAKKAGLIDAVMDVVDELRNKAEFWIKESFYEQIKALADE
ncbi:MAG: DUF3368 domain-containing protein [Saprospiraceae bacterium]|jgi:hypothetical protein|nr:DUF3368 domain-containing protein [Saprospiraceae bacterium]